MDKQEKFVLIAGATCLVVSVASRLQMRRKERQLIETTRQIESVLAAANVVQRRLHCGYYDNKPGSMMDDLNFELIARRFNN